MSRAGDKAARVLERRGVRAGEWRILEFQIACRISRRCHHSPYSAARLTQPTMNVEHLLCDETLDEVQKEFCPNLTEFAKEHTIKVPVWKVANRISAALTSEDVKLVNELGRLTPDQLALYIRNIQSIALDVSQMEKNAIIKGEVLDILLSKRMKDERQHQFYKVATKFESLHTKDIEHELMEVQDACLDDVSQPGPSGLRNT